MLCQQHLCQKLPKSLVVVRWSYSVQHQCRFFWDTVWFKLPSLTAGWVARLPVEKTHTAASCIAGWDSSNWHCHSISEEHEYWSGSVLMGAAPFHRSFAGWQCEHYRWQYWDCIFDRGLHGNWRDILFFFTDSGNMEKITNNNRQIQK